MIENLVEERGIHAKREGTDTVTIEFDDLPLLASSTHTTRTQPGLRLQ